jgi:hypothetical protein
MKVVVAWWNFTVVKKISFEFLFLFFAFSFHYAFSPFEHVYVAYLGRLVVASLFKGKSGFKEKVYYKGKLLHDTRPTFLAIAWHLLASICVTLSLVWLHSFDKQLFLEYGYCFDFVEEVITGVAIAALDAVMLVTLVRYLVERPLKSSQFY